jgi:hypothetical protein
MDFDNPIDEKDGWKLLDNFCFNDRTLIAWYNPDTSSIGMFITHLSEQPNELSKLAPESTWGFITHHVSAIYTCKEAAELVELYIKDMKDENYWWET